MISAEEVRFDEIERWMLLRGCCTVNVDRLKLWMDLTVLGSFPVSVQSGSNYLPPKYTFVLNDK